MVLEIWSVMNLLFCYFPFWGTFTPSPFPWPNNPLPPKKKKMKKNAGRYHHVMCTKNYDQIMYDS